MSNVTKSSLKLTQNHIFPFAFLPLLDSLDALSPHHNLPRASALPASLINPPYDSASGKYQMVFCSRLI
jgi:hypothetical protein